MKTQQHDTLTDRLQNIIQEAQASTETYTLGNMISGLGKRGYGLLLIILALPSALPVPAPGYSTPFGLAIMMTAIGLMSSTNVLALPKKIKDRPLNTNLLTKVIKKGEWFLGFIEMIVKPRQEWACRGKSLPLIGVMIIILAAIMAIPIPLTNTAPAAVIFCIGIGLLENDGLWMIAFLSIGIVLIMTYAVVLYIALAYGVEALITLKEKILQGFSMIF